MSPIRVDKLRRTEVAKILWQNFVCIDIKSTLSNLSTFLSLQLETRVKQLCKQNSESHKKSHQMEKVAQNMIFEKSNIQSQLNDRDRQIAFLLEKVKRLETFSRDDISIEEVLE